MKRPAPDRPRSILFLVPGFPADEQDTACLPAVQNYVARFGEEHPELQVHVLAFQYPFVRRTYRWKAVTVHALGGRNRRGLRRLPTWGRAAARALQLHRTTRLCVLHSFWLSECTWVAALLRRVLRLRLVATIAGQDAMRTNPYLPLLRLDGVTLTAGSAFAAGVFGAHSGRADVHVVPLGLDPLPPAVTPHRDLDLLGVGSLTPLKDFEAFVDLVAALVPAFPTLKACIAGDGPERAALLQRIAARGLQAHIELPGRLPREAVLRLMQRSRVLLHPSRYESQGYVFLEALAAGLHVVCREVGYRTDDEKVHACRSTEEMEAVLRRLLATRLDHTPAPVPSAADTVRAFERLYGLAPVAAPG